MKARERETGKERDRYKRGRERERDWESKRASWELGMISLGMKDASVCACVCVEGAGMGGGVEKKRGDERER